MTQPLSARLSLTLLAEGTLPTPRGIIKVRHEKAKDGKVQTKIDAPRELRDRIVR